MDCVEEAGEEGADGRMGTVGFLAGRGGGVDLADAGGLIGIARAVGVVALLSRDLGDFLGTYGRLLLSEAALADAVSEDRLLNAAIVSDTEGMGAADVPSSCSPVSPSDSETD